MAEVWRARNAVLGHHAAIKFLTGFAGSPEFEQRFLGEGKRQARLQHPNIVSAYDFLYVDGRSFLVMKYVKGETLDQRLAKLQAPMPLPAVISLSRDVLGALDYAHGEGVVHRDVKPSNILLENTGRAYVLDFGIALALGDQRVTRTGVSVGTPHYMSPEQIVSSKNLDRRSDIYSYGCVLFQMLTRVPPFDFADREGDTEFFVMEQHLRHPPRPLRELNPDVPEQIERIVLRCLEKQPSDRFETCQDLLAALSEPVPQKRAAAAPFAARTKLESLPALSPSWQPNYLVATPPPPPPVQSQPVISAIEMPAPPAHTGRGRKPLILWGVLGMLAAAGAGGYFWYSHNHEPVKVAQNVVQTDTANNIPQPPAKVQGNQRPRTPRKPAFTINHSPSNTASQQASQPTPPAPAVAPPPSYPATAQAAPKPIAPPPPAPNPQSGVLRCPGTPIYPNGHVEFRGLPNERLSYDYDHTKWGILLRKTGNRKDLILVSKTPVVQTSCQVTWRVIP